MERGGMHASAEHSNHANEIRLLDRRGRHLTDLRVRGNASEIYSIRLHAGPFAIRSLGRSRSPDRRYQ